MTFDQYSRCGYGCLYCFSQYQKGIGHAKAGYMAGDANAVNVHKVRQIFAGKTAKEFAPYITARKVMQWGGLADPFCPYEQKYGVGLELLKIFAALKYPLTFSTKGVWWTQDNRYMDLFAGQEQWNVKMSIITLDERRARMIERGVPTPAERLKAIERLAKINRGGVTLRLRPYIIGVSDDYCDTIRAAADAGATAISTEFLCVESRSLLGRQRLKEISKVAGRDLYTMYRKLSDTTGYMRLSRKFKLPIIQKMAEVAKECGVRLHVSDQHCKDYSANGSCCGLPDAWNYSRGQFCEALVIARERGSVRWSDIAEGTKHFDAIQFGHAAGYNCVSSENRAKHNGRSMADYLHWLWNNPAQGRSPGGMFHDVLHARGQDANGDVIYAYTALQRRLKP